jgi:hypothetical protein
MARIADLDHAARYLFRGHGLQFNSDFRILGAFRVDAWNIQSTSKAPGRSSNFSNEPDGV